MGQDHCPLWEQKPRDGQGYVQLALALRNFPGASHAGQAAMLRRAASIASGLRQVGDRWQLSEIVEVGEFQHPVLTDPTAFEFTPEHADQVRVSLGKIATIAIASLSWGCEGGCGKPGRQPREIACDVVRAAAELIASVIATDPNPHVGKGLMSNLFAASPQIRSDVLSYVLAQGAYRRAEARALVLRALEGVTPEWVPSSEEWPMVEALRDTAKRLWAMHSAEDHLLNLGEQSSTVHAALTQFDAAFARAGAVVGA